MGIVIFRLRNIVLAAEAQYDIILLFSRGSAMANSGELRVAHMRFIVSAVTVLGGILRVAFVEQSSSFIGAFSALYAIMSAALFAPPSALSSYFSLMRRHVRIAIYLIAAGMRFDDGVMHGA